MCLLLFFDDDSGFGHYHGCVIGNIFYHHAVGTDFCIVANGYSGHNFCSGTQKNIVSYDYIAVSNGNLLEYGAVLADNAIVPHNDAIRPVGEVGRSCKLCTRMQIGAK